MSSSPPFLSPTSSYWPNSPNLQLPYQKNLLCWFLSLPILMHNYLLVFMKFLMPSYESLVLFIHPNRICCPKCKSLCHFDLLISRNQSICVNSLLNSCLNNKINYWPSQTQLKPCVHLLSNWESNSWTSLALLYPTIAILPFFQKQRRSLKWSQFQLLAELSNYYIFGGIKLITSVSWNYGTFSYALITNQNHLKFLNRIPVAGKTDLIVHFIYENL